MPSNVGLRGAGAGPCFAKKDPCCVRFMRKSKTYSGGVPVPSGATCARHKTPQKAVSEDTALISCTARPLEHCFLRRSCALHKQQRLGPASSPPCSAAHDRHTMRGALSPQHWRQKKTRAGRPILATLVSQRTRDAHASLIPLPRPQLSPQTFSEKSEREREREGRNGRSQRGLCG